MHPIILFIAGVVIVLVGAEFIVRGASRLAALLGVRPMMIGLTVVSVGTSMPELAVGITAAAEGRGPLAVGNIAGTNIVNILLILGLSALIRPLPIQLLSIKLHLPVMIVAAVVLVAMAWNNVLSQFEGALLVAGGVLYTAALVGVSRRERRAVMREYAEEYAAAVPRAKGAATSLRHLTLTIVGIVLTVWGADLLVRGAADLARLFGVSDAIIGLTIVAIGTSAPELATTIVSTIRNDRDVAIGNLLGSSSYNILFILGATCIASSGGVDVTREILKFDLPFAAAVALVCVPITRDQLISRWEGGLFVAGYLVYLLTLVFLRA